ncbi:MAG: histidine--tRNA ligase [Actinomycetales bacterium]|nr:histidine--tRNA ligase [Actinomycetales bacterium]
MSDLFKAPKGTYDVVPPFSQLWLIVKSALSRSAELSGFDYIETPIFEDTALYVRGVGQSTDVVNKEMYTFEDRSGRSLSLRPEGTAGVLRAMLENRMDKGPLPAKVWYSGPNFRYEQPQSGRYRQHTQVGAEAIGSSDPALDATMIWMAQHGPRKILGLNKLRVLVNSIGCQDCRPQYRIILQDFLGKLALDEATAARIRINPLRVLDDKRPEIQQQLVDAPLPADHLCTACAKHHEKVLHYLVELQVEFEIAPRLVRGLDYYTRTTFELVHDGLGAQSAIGGGGRYDGLVAELGGSPLPGIGFGLGVDRTCLAVQAEGIDFSGSRNRGCYLIAMADAAMDTVIRLSKELAEVGIVAEFALDGRSMKAAMKGADRSGAKFALIIGEDELAGSQVTVKHLDSGEQEIVALDLVAKYISEHAN